MLKPCAIRTFEDVSLERHMSAPFGPPQLSMCFFWGCDMVAQPWLFTLWFCGVSLPGGTISGDPAVKSPDDASSRPMAHKLAIICPMDKIRQREL